MKKHPDATHPPTTRLPASSPPLFSPFLQPHSNPRRLPASEYHHVVGVLAPLHASPPGQLSSLFITQGGEEGVPGNKHIAQCACACVQTLRRWAGGRLDGCRLHAMKLMDSCTRRGTVKRKGDRAPHRKVSRRRGLRENISLEWNVHARPAEAWRGGNRRAGMCWKKTQEESTVYRHKSASQTVTRAADPRMQKSPVQDHGNIS